MLFAQILLSMLFATMASAAPAFYGKQHGIGSWFWTNKSSDSTNGHSWCGYSYQDDWVGFAPSVGTMIAAKGSDESAAKKAFCGRTAYAYNPANGKSVTMKLVDGFDDAWVKSPGSVDLTRGAFKALKGYTTDDKNDVIYNLEWTLN